MHFRRSEFVALTAGRGCFWRSLRMACVPHVPDPQCRAFAFVSWSDACAVCVRGVLVLLACRVIMGLPHKVHAATKGQIDQTIKKSVDYLAKNAKLATHNVPVLAAYAMIKAGESPERPEIVEILDTIKKKVAGGKYTPTNHQQFYEAGIDIMALEAAAHASGQPALYNDQIQIIVNYIIDGQAEAGSWFYPTQVDTGGDTSITQYAMLGLWAAMRAGVKVPPAVWDRAAAWHMKTQSYTGFFVYHPSGGSGVSSRHSMTVNGVASLCVCRMILFPNGDYTLPTPDQFPVPAILRGQTNEFTPRGGRRAAEKTKPAEPKSDSEGKAVGNPGSGLPDAAAAPAAPVPAKRKRKFGILERVDIGTGKRAQPEVVNAALAPTTKFANYRAQMSLKDINLGIARGIHWMNEHFTVERPDGWHMYYLYGLERMSALADLEAYGDHQWYAEGADYLVKLQRSDGSFPAQMHPAEGTSFALLFLTNATAQIISPDGKVRPKLGAGLLIGNRGLPENLSEINLTADGVQKKKVTGPIDEMLAELENVKSLNVEAVQAAIVEQVQLGNREALVGHRDRLLRLVEDPRVEVRRTATWALSRCGKLDDAPVFIRILDNDPDLSVAVEANNALCWLSRRPFGIIPKTDPFEGIDESAPEKDRAEAAAKWRQQLVPKWREWFASVQTYKDREFQPEPRPQ